jgi:hypothetical protein
MPRRRLLFAVLVAACLGGVGVALASAVRMGEPAETASAGLHDVLRAAETNRTPMIVARTVEPGHPEASGQVIIARPGDGARSRTRTSLNCARVYFAAGRGLCLARGKGFAAGYRARIFGSDMRVRAELPVEGMPSRARVSPDGRYGSVTLFVNGHSYADANSFSTTTTLIDMATGKKIAELEDFTVTRNKRKVTAVDVNFWGVTFARDSDRFYATMATGGKTYLIEGSVKARTARVLHENVECPSLSPDGTRVAYKQRIPFGKSPWRIQVLDLATMHETRLAEPRSVDDQVEWLDDDHVLYGLDDSISVMRADGSGAPRRFMTGADSPAVVRW